MNFSKKKFVEMLKFTEFWALEKRTISSFVQSGNFEVSSQTGFEPGPLSVTVRTLIHYTKSPYENFLKKIQI